VLTKCIILIPVERVWGGGFMYLCREIRIPMAILFDDIVFGPVNSRRLGISLGINLLPLTHKICTFDCAYCECGWTLTAEAGASRLTSGDVILDAARREFEKLSAAGRHIDAITFAGNGEPTLHPDFPEIIDGIIVLRNQYLPESKIAVLSNASTLDNPGVFNALSRIYYNIQKLDAGTESTFRLLNRPAESLSLQKIVDNLIRFDGKLMIQTLLVKGEVEGEWVDNTREEELNAWLEHISRIRPRYVMLYPIDRRTPAGGLQKVEEEVFEEVIRRLSVAGIEGKVYY